MKWIPYPFVRIVFFFICGILFGVFYPDVIAEHVALVMLIVLLIGYFVLLILTWKVNVNWSGITGLVIIFTVGYVYVLHRTESRKSDHIFLIRSPIAYYKARILLPLEEKDHSWKTEVSIEFVSSNGGWQQASGRVLVYFSRIDSVMPYHYGYVLLIKGSPLLVQPPVNPGEFDYKQYLRYRNIYHQHFVKSGHAKLIVHENGAFFMALAFHVRRWANDVLHQYVAGRHEQAIASALILGVTNELDADLYGAYASAGVMHILSVSGLHVGIVYLIIFLLLQPITKIKGGKWLVAIICIVVLWAYAFVTGMSPSVLRAVIMFSFLALAKPQNFRTNIYNTLAVSAFIILVIDPFFIMSVGFQLSYLAVLGIVYLQPGLYVLWEPQSYCWDKIWKVTSVSIAAQIATFALSFLYFHQFPNYFLIFNLIVIPISFVVLIAGLLLLAVSPITSVSIFVGWCLGWLIKIMNMIIFSVDSLPFSLINHVYITPFQCAIIMGGCISVILLLKTKQFRYLVVAAFFVGCYSATQWFHYVNEVKPAGLTVYHVPKHAVVDLFDDGKFYDMHDSTFCHTNAIDKYMNPNRFIHGATSVSRGIDKGITTSLNGARLILWKGKYILNITTEKFRPVSLPPLDYVIISNNAVSDLLILTHQLNFKKLIIDSSNSFYFADGLRRHAIQLKIDFHSVWHSGAFCSRL
jgi:competence protein ComEC